MLTRRCGLFLPAARRLRVKAAFSAAARRFAALRFRVAAAFCPAAVRTGLMSLHVWLGHIGSNRGEDRRGGRAWAVGPDGDGVRWQTEIIHGVVSAAIRDCNRGTTSRPPK
jgi:hypothetical protein